MGTRSTIALEYADGTVHQVYCHWDGYISHNGRILENSWKDPFKLQKLMDLGDLSILGNELGDKQDFDKHKSDWCLFYGRDRDEPDTKARKFWNFEMYRLEGQSEEYDYILRCIDGKAQWFVRCNSSKDEFVPLENFAEELNEKS